MKDILKKAQALRQTSEESIPDLAALMMAADKAVENILHGGHARRKAGAGEKFWQFREYTTQDRPQDIDWRQSAKTDRIYIRQKERQSTQTVTFWRNSGAGMNFKSPAAQQTKAQAANIITLAMAILLARAGERVGLLGMGRAGRSELSIEGIGRALCTVQEEVIDLPKLSDQTMPRNGSFISVGDFLNPLEEIEKTFRKFSERTASGFVVQVLDPAEIELPYSGRVVFETSNGYHRVLINDAASVRAAYKKKIEDHIEGLERICRQCGWDYILHRTDTPVKETLIRIWQQMDRRTSYVPEIRR